MTDVSRETPPAPDAAQGVFGVRLALAERYAGLLGREGELRGLIGPRELPRLWERHLLNCALVTELIPEGARVADIGTGAGLPGLVIAIRRPDLEVTLIEPMARRTDFLVEAVAELGLERVRVVRARAEDVARVDASCSDFDVVTSRAVAPLDRLGRWTMPLVRGGGAMLAMKGTSAAAEVEIHDRALRRLGATSIAVVRVGASVVDDPVTVVQVEKRQDPHGRR
jgi:16S rRNA (guanine527-N7)-methyltransferase